MSISITKASFRQWLASVLLQMRKGSPYQDLHRLHAIVLAKLILLHMGVQEAEGPEDEKG